MADKKPATKKKVKRVVLNGRAYITAGFNNTIVTITDSDGAVLSWGSAGAAGFKGSRKSTPYAAQMAAEMAANGAKTYGMENVAVVVKGVGSGREQSIRGLHLAGLNITQIKDITPVPHGGCRPKKPRKV